jgi:hypothetical protein
VSAERPVEGSVLRESLLLSLLEDGQLAMARNPAWGDNSRYVVAAGTGCHAARGFTEMSAAPSHSQHPPFKSGVVALRRCTQAAVSSCTAQSILCAVKK